ncbi:MAG TPA: ParB/RepB/Spo0J family partition protein [Azospirillum sp.]|nr:ParB/RepB/Spo0J family partition protein [Azospirillum sp.]
MNVPNVKPPAPALKDLGDRTIPLADIDVGERLRAIDEGHAMLLAENIRESGRMRQRIEVLVVAAGYRLIAGGHRYRAAQILGWTHIEVRAYSGSDDAARLAEIDENLVRHDLNPLDRAVFLAERKALYEKLHPETKAGVAGGKARQGAATDIMSFARDTAERCGLDERTIQRAVMIASRLAPEVRARIAGTWIARKQSELLALAKVEPAKRLAVIDALLADDSPVNTVQAALRVVDGAAEPVSDDREKKVAALRKAWDRAGRQGRRAWLAELQAEGRLDELRELLAEIEDRGSRRRPAPVANDGAEQIDLEEVIRARTATTGAGD